MEEVSISPSQSSASQGLPDDAFRGVSEDTIERHTGSLLDPYRNDVVFAMTMPYSRDTESAPYYLAVPKELAQVQARHHLQMWAWRVELHRLGENKPPLGLDILGPVMLGRTSPRDPAVDVDFTPYDGFERGVSRRHALIRPSEERLYLIDLSSTNGTRRNEVPLGAGIAVTLEDRDTVALGELTFEIRILRRPDPALASQRKEQGKLHDTQPVKRDEVPPAPPES